MQSELPDSGLREFLLWLVRRRQRFRVTGNSMLPLLQPGEEILINPNAYRQNAPQPGDIVIAYHPQQSTLRLVKRVVGTSDNGQYLLEGDNPLESTDSRFFGPVSAHQILGRVTSRFG